MNNKFDLIAEYHRLAKTYNLTDKQIKDIYESQFHFTRLAMKEGVHDEPETFKNINFIYLGKLYVKKGVVLRMKKSNDRRKMKEEKILEGFVIDPEKTYCITNYNGGEPKVGDYNYYSLGKYLEPKEIQLLQRRYIKEYEQKRSK